MTPTQRKRRLSQLDGAVEKVLRKKAPETTIAELAADFPTLLLEQPPSYPMFASYLQLARAEEWPSTLEVALGSGVHPDDKQLFGCRTMLQTRVGSHTLPGPALVRLGLRFGAQSNQVANPDVKTPWCLARHYARLAGTYGLRHFSELQSNLACLRLLMEADPGQLDSHTAPGGTICHQSFLGMLGSSPILGTTDPIAAAAKEEVFALMRLAVTKGADLNWRHPHTGRPSTWDLVTNNCIESAILLLDLGAPADWTPPADDSRYGGVTNLADMAFMREGNGARARVREALMRQRIRAEAKVSKVSPAAPPTRRLKAL